MIAQPEGAEKGVGLGAGVSAGVGVRVFVARRSTVRVGEITGEEIGVVRAS